MADKKTSDKEIGDTEESQSEDRAPDVETSDDVVASQTVQEGDDQAEAESTPDATEPADADAADDDTPPYEAEGGDTNPPADMDTEDRDAPAQATPETAAQDTQSKVIVRKGGFFPLLLGGIAAGVIGFGAARYLGSDWPFGPEAQDDFQQEFEQRLQSQSATIDELSARLEEVREAGDTTGVEMTQSEILKRLDEMAEQVSGISADVQDVDSRLTAVEKRPVAEGASDAAIAAYERELKALQDAMAQQRADIEEMTQQAQTLEDNAEATARSTMRRAAVTRIQTALDAGSGFASAIADLQAAGVSVPEPLVERADQGVPTLAALQDSFPDAARRALSASRSATDETAGLGGFLRDQLGIRSLTPKEGDGPDAVLSRAEAAVRDGRLQDALAEIEALPEAGRDELSEWSSRATQRLQALRAAESLTQDLN